MTILVFSKERKPQSQSLSTHASPFFYTHNQTTTSSELYTGTHTDMYTLYVHMYTRAGQEVATQPWEQVG